MIMYTYENIVYIKMKTNKIEDIFIYTILCDVYYFA